MLTGSLGLLFLVSLLVLVIPEPSFKAIETASLWVRTHLGYLYLYLGLFAVLFIIALSFSPWGRIRLGSSDKGPEHSLWSWIAMLYSAGMGAGILLRAVQEPVYMQQHPPVTKAIQPEILALEYTFYQWGFTPWAFYGVFAVVIGYAMFNRKQAVRTSAVISDHISSNWARNGIDLMTILTTVFGLIAALGLGTTQIAGGLTHLQISGSGLHIPIFLTLLICIMAFISAWKGLNKGIKVLSQINIAVTLGVLVYVFIFSPWGQVFSLFVQATARYLIDFFPLSLAWGEFDPGIRFLTEWTFYYWAFWLAWAPFTGIFIARISRGRTLRQVLLGVLLIPSLGTFIWFSVFGVSAFERIGQWGIYDGEFDNVFTSIFVFLQYLPMPGLLNAVAVLLLIGFLVTSVDSAILVLSMFTDRGKLKPRTSHRLLWSVILLVAAIALLILGSVRSDIDILVAAQKVLILTSLPFALFLVVMCVLFCLRLARR